MPQRPLGLITGNITGNAQRVSADVTGYAGALITVHGTYAGVNLTFNISDDAGTTVYPVAGERVDTAALETTTGALTNSKRAWLVPTPAANYVEVLSTAYISGTQVVDITPTNEADALLSAGGSGGGAVTGTVTANQGTAGIAWPVLAGGYTTPVAITVTRPADTNAYAANDAIANATSSAAKPTWAVGRVANGTGTIAGVLVQSTNTANTARFEIDFYTTLAAAVNDNAEAVRLSGDAAAWLGTVTMPALAKKTSSSTVAEAINLDVRLPFLADGSSNIYGVVRTLDVFTPTSGAVLTITLLVYRD